MKRKGQLHLVAIALNSYKELPPLKAPVHDAESLADILSTAYGLERGRIGRLYNEVATNRNIMQLLRSLKTLPAEDTLIIYYAGHGKTDGFDQMNFWLPYDAGADATERVRWLPSHTVIGAMRRSGAQHVLLLNDSCFSGDFVGTSRDLQEKREGYRDIAQKYSAKEVITSGMSEVVDDSGMDGHSPFAWHLLNGLKNHGEAWIDTDELYEYVKRGVVGQTPLHRVLPEAGHQDGGLVVLSRQEGSVGEKPPQAATRTGSDTVERVESVTARQNRDEQPVARVYKCPICGLRNREEETFECKVCGRDYLCRDHFDKEFRCCEECAANQQKEAEAKRKAEEVRKADAKRKKEQEQREKAKREEEQRRAACRKLENGLVPMKYVEGGNFYMGSDDGNADSIERPVHQVQVDSFFMGIYPVIQEQYREVIGKNPSYFDSERDSARRPVENVSWYDAVVFCNRLSIKEGLGPVYELGGSSDPDRWGPVPDDDSSRWDNMQVNWEGDGYRLPTEAEWEYAARGGLKSGGYTYAGSNDPDEVAWYTDSNDPDDFFTGTYSFLESTHPVGEKKPNELGLYDMSGNVQEWCWDWFDYDYYEKSPKANPKGAAFDSMRVLRGGASTSNPYSLRTTFRDFRVPSGGYGFRVVVPRMQQ